MFDDQINFLTYMCANVTYGYGVEGTELKNTISRCATRAYQDLKRRVPYSKNFAESNLPENKAFREKKDLFKQNVIDIIVSCIMVDGSLVDEENICPRDIIAKVYGEGNSQYADLFKSKFTLGLSQKWVNMTLKYLWAVGVIQYGESLDVPVDSYVIKAATSKVEKNKTMGLGIDYSTYKKNSKSSWSSWDDFAEYEKFQEEIAHLAMENMGLTKICWENSAWIEEAKKRRK